MTNAERRQHPRARSHWVFFYDETAAGLSMGRTLDISSSGARIETYEPLRSGTIKKLEVIASDRRYFISGTVVYDQEIGKGVYIAGIRFDRPYFGFGGGTTRSVKISSAGRGQSC